MMCGGVVVWWCDGWYERMSQQHAATEHDVISVRFYSHLLLCIGHTAPELLKQQQELVEMDAAMKMVK